MVRFDRVNKYQYLATDIEDIIKETNDIIDNITNRNSYIEPNNRDLFQTILSRVLSREFFKSVTIDDDALSLIVDLSYKDTTYTFSFGIMPDPEDGAKVKYVESYYIR